MGLVLDIDLEPDLDVAERDAANAPVFTRLVVNDDLDVARAEPEGGEFAEQRGVKATLCLDRAAREHGDFDEHRARATVVGHSKTMRRILQDADVPVFGRDTDALNERPLHGSDHFGMSA